jgi:hypothetical protein
LLQVANCKLCLRPADCGAILVQPVAAEQPHARTL